MSDVDFKLQRRNVVVTGGSNGIGAACAQRLARDGASIAIWDVAESAGYAFVDQLTAAGSRAFYVRCDVSQSRDVATALDETLAALGDVDGLISNAGIFRAADFLDVAEADWDAVLDVNLKGAFLVGQTVARHMARRGGGAIVNMSSVNGVLAIPNLASYNASKGAIDQLTRAMALALADRGVRVNAVAPGTIATELAANAVLGSDEARRKVLGRTPLGRLGSPEEVAEVCAFLLSDASSYMTGQIVYVDGGRLALNYTVPVR